MELEELREHEGIDVKHYLMVDAHYTWWDCGRSYLCRIIDMLHMGYVDEVLFGREVVERLPILVKEWVAAVSAGEKEKLTLSGLERCGVRLSPCGVYPYCHNHAMPTAARSIGTSSRMARRLRVICEEYNSEPTLIRVSKTRNIRPCGRP